MGLWAQQEVYLGFFPSAPSQLVYGHTCAHDDRESACMSRRGAGRGSGGSSGIVLAAVLVVAEGMVVLRRCW